MKIAITGIEGDSAISDLAEDLAMLRMAAGKRVLLVPPNPRTYDEQLFDDQVIDASSSETSLIQADVIVTLLRPDVLGSAEEAILLARLQRVQSFNPSARVLIAIAHGRRPLSSHETGCLLVFVAQLFNARLADMLVLAERAETSHSRHSELELSMYKEERKLSPPEMRHLYREIFSNRRMRDLPPCPIPRQTV